MKEQIKKLVAFVTSALMALALVPGIALAATGDITVNGAIKDATYTAYKVFDATYSGTAVSYTIPTGSSIATTEGFSTVFTTHENGGVTYVEKAANATDEQVITWLKNHESSLGVAVKTVTNSDGASIITLNTGAAGYYYVKSTVGDKTAVTIDTAHPTATVNSKIESNPIVPTDGKKVGGKTVNTMEVGETGTFTLTFDATNYKVSADGTSEKITSYTVDDTMDGFSISNEQLSALTVTVGGNSLNSTASDNAPYFTAQKTDNGLQVVIHNYDKGNYTSPSEVVISYEATLTNKNLAAKSTNKFTVENVSGSSETHTYNYTVEVTKTDDTATNAKTLSGAKFVLKKGDKFYKVDGNGVVSWVDSKDQATEVTTGADGKANFQGLEAGNYTLVETQAPAGYTLAADTPFTLDEATAANEASLNLTKAITVQDKAGSTLPTTGGMGTTLFTVVGAALVVAAGVLLVTRRRMQQ